MAVWNIHDIAAMDDETRVRNACRQIEQECIEWNRSLGFGGKECSRGEQWTGHKRVSLHCGGYHPRQYVRVAIDGKPVGEKIRVKAGTAVSIYLAIMEARDSLE